MYRRALIFLLLLLACVSNAQDSRFFSREDGLSSTLIRFLYEDRNGMMWIATENGLNRYDGSRFVQYSHNAHDPHSLASNFVNSLFEDSQGRLYVCSHSGVQLYNPLTDSFSVLAEMDGTRSGQVNVIKERSNGELWAVGNFISRIHVEGDKLSLSRIPVDSSLHFGDYALEDENSNFWVVRYAKGAFRLSPDGTVSEYLTDTNYSLRGIYEGYSGEILLASVTNGPLRYDPVLDVFTPVSDQLPSCLCVNVQNSAMLLAGTDNGIQTLDLESGNVSEFVLQDGRINLKDYRIIAMFRDGNGNLWAGAYQQGLLMIPAQRNNFRYIGRKSPTFNIIGNSIVSSMLRHSDGRMYIATNSDGIYTLSPDNSASRHYAPGDGPDEIPAEISKLFLDSRGTLWTGFVYDGVATFDPSTGKCSRLPTIPSPGGGEGVSGFAEDDKGNLWVTTMGAGLFSVNLDSGRITHVSAINTEIPLYITSIIFASDGKLYIGTYDGGWVIDPENVMDFFSISDDNIVYSVEELSNGTIAFACENGLMLWPMSNPLSKDCPPLLYRDGDAANGVYSVLNDSAGHIWITTNKGGLCRLSENYETLSVYGPEDGVGSHEFNKGVGFVDRDGTLWFGSLDGIVGFRPREIYSHTQKWTIRITGLLLDDRSVTGETKSGRYVVLDKPIYREDEINLNHKDNSFTVLLSTVEHNAPELLQFMFRLDGGYWVRLPSGQRRITFSGLTAKTHRLEFKAVDNGIESDTIGLDVSIHPSFWATRMMKAVYVLIPILAVIVFFVLRQRSLRLQLRKYFQTDRIPSPHRMEAESFRLEYSTVDIVELLASAVKDYCEKYPKKNVQFSHPDVKKLEVSIDPDCFDKIVYNLLSNAGMFAPKNGEISIDLHTADNACAEIVVCCKGKVARSGKHWFITKLFSSSKDKVYQGRGIFITKFLVELHHGQINVEHSDDGRPRFIVSVPFKQPKPESVVPSPDPAVLPENIAAGDSMPQGRRSKVKVLLAVDDAGFRQAVATEFATACRIVEADNGSDAFKLAFSEKPDVIVCSLAMPGMSGLELCDRVKHNPILNHIPVILLIDKSEESAIMDSLKTGVDSFITKPVSTEVLGATIMNVVRNRHILRNNFSGQQSINEKIPAPKVESPDEKLMARIMRVLGANLSNPDLTIEMFASEIGISRVHLHRKLKELTNQTTSDFIRNTRLSRAAKILSEGKHSISEVAYLVGFDNQANFSTAFKRMYGMTPREYMQTHSQNV